VKVVGLYVLLSIEADSLNTHSMSKTLYKEYTSKETTSTH